MKFFSDHVALCLYKSTIWPCMEYFCHVGLVLSFASYLNILNKLQKLVCRAVCSSVAATLEPLLILEL